MRCASPQATCNWAREVLGELGSPRGLGGAGDLRGAGDQEVLEGKGGTGDLRGAGAREALGAREVLGAGGSPVLLSLGSRAAAAYLLPVQNGVVIASSRGRTGFSPCAPTAATASLLRMDDRNWKEIQQNKSFTLNGDKFTVIPNKIPTIFL